MFANLLNNAVKFSHSGTAISLSLRREADQAVVVVKDEGQGIDAASLDTVFDLFAQGPAPVAREAPSGGVDPCLRVLVVDDNRDAADTLATSLQFEGHDVTVVYDGPSALNTFERVLPDVVRTSDLWLLD